MKKKTQPPQEQKAPGTEKKMSPPPKSEDPSYIGSKKFTNKVVLITGGDSGIGKATAISFAKEGAKLVLIYLSEDNDAQETKKIIEAQNTDCLLIKGDLGNKIFCDKAIEKVIATFSRLDVLINNAAEQHPQEEFLNISEEQLKKTFQTNIFSMFYLTQAALSYLKKGSSIINTTSITAYRGSEHLIDYASTKGAIVAFTRSLAKNLATKEIRVNNVAPGPIWTPLISSTFKAKEVAKFGSDTLMGRAGQPYEVAGAYIFLASREASYITGQTIHVNGGSIING